MTATSIDPLPENLKANLRTCSIIQPDFRRVVVALLTCNGLIQGFTNSEALAFKLVEFLEQLPVVIQPNDFFANSCRNLKIIAKVIQLTAIKFRLDKGKRGLGFVQALRNIVCEKHWVEIDNWMLFQKKYISLIFLSIGQEFEKNREMVSVYQGHLENMRH